MRDLEVRLAFAQIKLPDATGQIRFQDCIGV
jgi:hypothetical protein